MKIKICGLKYLSNIKALSQLNVDYMGFIFHKPSPRYFNNGVSFDEARQIPKHIRKTGVFVNEPVYSILNLVSVYDLDAVQLHGNESPEECLELRSYVKVIKAFGIKSEADLEKTSAYVNCSDHFLFDTLTAEHGGSGKTFDWNILKTYNSDVSFFLSGGISPELITQIKNLKHSKLEGIDINSRFETEPGLKDVDKIKEFINLVKN